MKLKAKLIPGGILAGALIVAAGCSTSRTPAATGTHTRINGTIAQPQQGELPIGGSVNTLPKAHIYRMTGNYSLNVPLQLSPSGELISFPDPHDISKGSEPIQLADGWWLDRRGVSVNSVFTTYTYSEYMALPAPPSVAELKKAIIPGSGITELAILPMLPAEAASHIEAVDSLIRQGLPGCDVQYGVPEPVAAP